MTALRLLVGAESATPAAVFSQAIALDVTNTADDGGIPLLELLVDSAVAGIRDPARGFVTVSGPSGKLSDQPEHVHALVCSVGTTSAAEPGFIVLLTPTHGPTFILPRAGAASASQVRVRLADGTTAASNMVAVARGADPYATLLEAVKTIAQRTGVPEADVHADMLPLLDGVNRMRYDSALATTNGAFGKMDVANAPSYEQQLHENILVQAGPDCPAKPLLQAPGLRVCQGMSSPLGVRYSGMSVVYGTATGHVLAVMDTTSALKLAPHSSIRSSGADALITSRGSGSVCSVGAGGDSPSAVSAGVSDTSSAAPSPPMSRASSCGGIASGDSPSLDAAVAAASACAAPQDPVPLMKALSGRSITTAPIIQVLAAAVKSRAAKVSRPLTPTGAQAQVLTSFAIVGIKSSSSRDGFVRCCRIMPASTLGSAVSDAAAVASVEDAARHVTATNAASLGLVVQLEVVLAAAGILLMFVEGPDEATEGLDSWEDVTPVRAVSIDSHPARWRYDSTGAMLAVEMPASASPQATAPRQVQVFL